MDTKRFSEIISLGAGFVSAPTGEAISSTGEAYTVGEIKEIFRTFWRKGYGSVAVDEALFIQDLISHYAPARFLEIGTASGLSAGLIARFMERFSGQTLTTIDHDNTFFGDPTKQNGFLIEQIYSGTAITVTKRPFKTALDLYTLRESFDMAFIDANHQHPWPIIDTLCLYPHLEGSRVVIHHDLRLFRKQDIVFGIGPKYLFDQFPESHKICSQANQGNIFALSLDMPREALEAIAADAFSLPWSLRSPLAIAYLDKFRETLAHHYSSGMLEIFNQAAARFNVMDRFRSGL